MQRPNEGKGSVQPSTINYKGDDGGINAIDRQIEAALDKIVLDSPFDFKSGDEAGKIGYENPMRGGFPRHEW